MGGLTWRQVLLSLVTALLMGCTSYAPQLPPAPDRDTLGRIAVVAGTDVPEIGFEGFAHDKVEGAAQGAGQTFLICLSTMGPSGCGGPYCGAFAVLWLGVCGAAGAIGGVTGAAVAPSGESVRGADARMRAALDANVIQESLRHQIELAARAQGIEPATTGEADTLLEATLVQIGTAGGGINAPVELQMAVRVRLLRAADREERYAARIRYLGERYTIAEWSANDAARLLGGLTAGYAALAAQIADGAFLLYPFPDQQFGSGGFLSSAFGLAPVDPQTRGTLTGDPLFGDRFEWTQVSSLQPTLRWEPFPRPADITAAPSEMARVSNVTYDLVIAREHNYAAGDVVYRRRGLAAPTHRLETPLVPNARYFWTVRARFALDGAARVTGWSSTNYVARDGVTAPSRYSYRFRTP